MIRLLLLTLLLVASSAHAKCTAQDSWRGADKAQHLGIGAVIGAAGTLYTGSRWQGVALGAGVGALKEVVDSTGRGTCSFQDFAVTAVGAAIGAQFGGFVVALRRESIRVSYSRTF